MCVENSNDYGGAGVRGFFQLIPWRGNRWAVAG